jgi:hypothetical protein
MWKTVSTRTAHVNWIDWKRTHVENGIARTAHAWNRIDWKRTRMEDDCVK